MLNYLKKITLRKYLVIDNRRIRMIEMVVNACLLVALLVIGAYTNIMYYPTYITAKSFITPKPKFLMEGRLNYDLFRVDQSDFIFELPGDVILLPKK